MKNVFVLISFVVAFTACSKDNVKISGRIDNASDTTMLYLDEVDVYNTRPVDSVKLGKSGRYRFKTSLGIPGFYQLRLSPEKVIVLFPKQGDNITIDADAGNLPKSVKARGSHDTEQITKLIIMLAETRSRLDSVAVLYEKAVADTLKTRLNKEYLAILESYRRVSIAYMLTNYNSLSSVYALYQQYQPGHYIFYKTTDIQYFKILSDSLSKYHPKSRHVQALKTHANKMVAEYNTRSLLQQANVEVSDLPKLELPDYTGKTTKLSSLKGKYVLLSFWVSGNQACLSQNLELKKIYEKYRNKSFEIYQVSFDNSRERWQRAVRFDELPWISVIDTLGPYSVVAGNFNVNQLPANYLISKDNSTILGKNLTPLQLRDKLEDLYN